MARSPDAVPDLGELASDLGWPPEELRTIEAYRDSTATYYLAAADEVSDMFCRTPGGFDLLRRCRPSYELAECFPTLVLQRRAGRPTDRDETGAEH